MRISRLLSLCAAGVVYATSPSVTIQNGIVNGGKCAMSNSNYFRGIPYGEPPTGNMRFSPPKKFTRKFDSKGFDATAAPASCPQFGTSFIEQGPQSEDCLTLDVYVPNDNTNTGGLPVKVWLYGGSNEAGGISNPLYNGCFASTDSIIVTVNYRVGPLGYLSLEPAGLGGNYATQDQLMALQWVQSNIKSFGGNPSKVLLYGQSGGAKDVAVIGSLPQVKGLVSSAAVQSGGFHYLPTTASIQAFSAKFVTRLNCSLSDAACLRAVSITQMNATIQEIQSGGLGAGSPLSEGPTGGWSPVVDGHVIKQQPLQVGMRIPSIIGSAAADGSLILLGGATQLASLTADKYEKLLSTVFGPLAGAVSKEYPFSQFEAKGKLAGATALTSVVTDYAFKCSAHRGLVNTAGNGVPAWGYNWNHTPHCPWLLGKAATPETLKLLGPTHTSDIPFVFGTTDHLPPQVGPNETAHGGCSMTSSEKNMSSFMVQTWTGLADKQLPADKRIWPQFTNSSMGVTFGDATFGAQKLDYSKCAFWDKIETAMYQKALNGTNTTSGGASPSTGSFTPAATPTKLTSAGTTNQEAFVHVKFIGTMAFAVIILSFLI